MTPSDSDAPPTVEEARLTLAHSGRRLARGVVLCFCGLVLAIMAVEGLRVFRVATVVGFSEFWQQGGAESLFGDVLMLPILAVAVWFGAPRVLAMGYESLIRDGRLVRATVVAGPETITRRVRMDGTPLATVEDVFSTLLPTRLVNYRIEGSKTSVLGALYADERIGGDPAACWALTTPNAAGRKSWIYRRRKPHLR
jgi:hypothetical protein